MHSQDSTVNTKGPFKPEITVIGVGGAGGNAVNNMIASNLDGVTFMVTNTDAQALENSLSPNILQLGTSSTGGLGAGARPEIGRAAAEESLELVMSKLENQNMVFITAGMGGGTGTGAAPVIAKACKERDILTVGVVTKPFQFEGAQRMRLAEEGIEELAQYVDTLIVIPNQNLFRIANEKTTFSDAFRMADEVLQSGVKGVTDLMVVPGMINLDFADIRSATSEMGKAMMGTGEATGDNRAIEAAEQAINNPLLDDVSMKGARSVLINVCGGHDLTLFEIEEATNRITEEVDPDATIIFGTSVNDSLEGSMRITVVATGIEDEMNTRVATRQGRAAKTPFTQPRHVNDQVYYNNTMDSQSHADTPKAPAAPVVDSFTTRYPEPSRVAVGQQNTQTQTHSNMSSSPIAPMSMDNAGSGVDIGQVAAADQSSNVAAASLNNSNVINTYDAPQQNTGMINETQYVTEGSTVRKLEPTPQENTLRSNQSSVIPPFAPARTVEHNNQVAEKPLATEIQKQPMQTSGYHGQNPQSKKTPSLFERITGRNRQEGDDENNVVTETSSGSNSDTGSMPSGLTATRKTVATAYDTPVAPGQQGAFNIDGLAAQPKKTQVTGGASDDLDIPAFLRRQIS